MNRGVLQHAGKMARYMSRRMMLTAGVAALALLTYCGVQKGEDLDPVRDPPAIFPSDDPGTMALYNLAPIARWFSKERRIFPTGQAAVHKRTLG